MRIAQFAKLLEAADSKAALQAASQQFKRHNRDALTNLLVDIALAPYLA